MKLNEISLYDLHKDPKSLYGYDKADMEVVDVFWGRYKDNFKELEKREDAIAKSPKYAYYYAVSVIKGRFPKGERAIATSPEFAYQYAHNIIKGRFPEGEPAIAKKPGYAYYYAKYVLKRQWPEGEKVIAKNPDTKESYEHQFGVKL